MSTESLLIRRRVSMIATGVLAAAVALSIALVVGWVPVELAVMLRSRPSSGDGSDDDSARDASPLHDRAQLSRAAAPTPTASASLVGST